MVCVFCHCIRSLIQKLIFLLNSSDLTTLSDKGIRSYWVTKNMSSIDGIPGLAKAPNSDMAKDKTVWDVSGKKKYKSDEAMTNRRSTQSVDKSFLLGLGVGAVAMGLFSWARIGMKA